MFSTRSMSSVVRDIGECSGTACTVGQLETGSAPATAPVPVPYRAPGAGIL